MSGTRVPLLASTPSGTHTVYIPADKTLVFIKWKWIISRSINGYSYSSLQLSSTYCALGPSSKSHVWHTSDPSLVEADDGCLCLRIWVLQTEVSRSWWDSKGTNLPPNLKTETSVCGTLWWKERTSPCTLSSDPRAQTTVMYIPTYTDVYRKIGARDGSAVKSWYCSWRGPTPHLKLHGCP